MVGKDTSGVLRSHITIQGSFNVSAARTDPREKGPRARSRRAQELGIKAQEG